MIEAELFKEFASLAFLAFGGASALLPEMHRVVVLQRHWMEPSTFAHLYAIAQAAPGPNVLVVTLIGWELAGLSGAFAATLGMCLPMSIVIYLLAGRWEQFAGTRWQSAIQLAVAPLAVGLIFAASILIAGAAELSANAWLYVIAVSILANVGKLHPLWFIAIGGMLGYWGKL